MLQDERVLALRVEESLPGRHLEQDQAERIEIAAGRDLSPRQLLRGHVGGSADEGVLTRRLRHHGKAEVGDARPAAAVDHHVGRLEVAMDDAFLVDRGQSRAEVACDLEGLVRRQPSDPRQERLQVLAVDVLHGQEGLVLDLHDVVEAAHARMGHLAAESDLAVEPLEDFGRQRAPDELQGDGLAELEVVRAVHLAHAAPAQPRHHAVARGQDRARSEAAFGRRGRRPAGRGLRVLRAQRPVGERRIRAAPPRRRTGGHQPVTSPRRRSACTARRPDPRWWARRGSARGA